MIPTELHRSKVNEDLPDFIDEVYKIVTIMGVSYEKKVEFNQNDLNLQQRRQIELLKVMT